MNAYEKDKLREHWKRPGTLQALLRILPMVPCGGDPADTGKYKMIAWMTGTSFDPEELAQVYYMLEEDGVIVREDEQPEPAAYLRCSHMASGTCPACSFEVRKRGVAAAVRYRLARPLGSR